MKLCIEDTIKMLFVMVIVMKLKTTKLKTKKAKPRLELALIMKPGKPDFIGFIKV